MPKVKEGKRNGAARPSGKTAARPAAKASARAKPAPRTAAKKAAPSRAARKAKPEPKAKRAMPARPKQPAKSAPARKGASARTKKSATRRREPVKLEPVRDVRIRELDPQAKCGPGTSVVQLFRVDESLGRELTTHLVFFDRHGWYCEHGRSCRAVADVHKLGKRMVVGL